MSSATMARWSMPLVCMGGLQKRAYCGNERRGIVAGNVVTRLDFYELQPRIRGAHLGSRFRRKHVGTRAAHLQDRGAHLADQLPHIKPELRALAGLEQPLELVAKVRIAFDRAIGPQVRLHALAVAL